MARSMSLLAPVVTSSKISSSATRPPHHDAEHILELILGPQVAVFRGQQGGVAAHVAAGDDANLVHAVGVGQVPGDQGMTGFVVGGHLLFALVDDAALALGAGDDPLDGFLEVRHEDAGLVLACGQQRRLVDQVGKVGAAETGSFASDDFQVDFSSQWFAGGVNPQDGVASDHVGQVQRNAAVETTGAQQGRIKDVGPVGGGNDDDVGVGLEAVHFDRGSG